MTIYDYFQLRLKELNRQGATDRVLAEKAGVSHAQINRMRNAGVQYLEKVGLGTLVKLFPDIFDRLLKEEGHTVSISGNGSAASVNGNATVAPMKDYSHLRKEILEDGEICDRCKIKMLTHLENE